MSMTLAYIIFAIVLLHLLLGFAWVIYRFMKKSPAEQKVEKKTDKSM
jgi:cytochrome bd-type quinol oxidase subunit 1